MWSGLLRCGKHENGLTHIVAAGSAQKTCFLMNLFFASEHILKNALQFSLLRARQLEKQKLREKLVCTLPSRTSQAYDQCEDAAR